MRNHLAGAIALGALLLAPLVTSGQTQTLAQRYQQALQPALSQRAAIKDAGLAWDALHFQLHSGSLALAAPLGGRVATAVFRGQGELDVAPPNPIARQQMQFLLAHPSIAVPFTEAIFRFADGAQFQKALRPAASFQPNSDQTDLAAVLAERANMIGDDGMQGVARQMLALDAAAATAPAQPGWFLAALKTSYGWVVARFDPLDTEAVQVSQYHQRAGFGIAVFDDVWAHFPAAAQAAAAPGTVAPLPAPDQLDDYQINVNIPGNLDMQAQTSVKVTARRGGRGLLLTLDPNLRITAAQLAGGGPIEFLQPRDPGHLPPPTYVGDWMYLRLPTPLAPGQSVILTLHYDGKQVVQRVGPGNFFARSSGWYPSNIFGAPVQRAQFHLQFENDKKYTLIATGVRQTNQRQGDEQITTWSSPKPLTVAGFALGDYSELSKKVTLPDKQSVAVNVLSNNQPDDEMAELKLEADPTQMLPGTADPGGAFSQGSRAVGSLNTRNLAPRALKQVAGALQFMALLYGPYPYASLDIVPIPGNYGQGWPGLLYLSDLSFLDSTQLTRLGIGKTELDQLTDTFRAHEVSHQWWGHRVGWATYHDEWMSEGFANGSGLLLQFTADGAKAGLATLEQWRRDLETKSRLGNVHEQDGPLWLGQRLASSMDPDGYQDIVYEKGGYVLYMLRQMMMDPRSKTPDAAFIATMHDFTSTYANRNASTRDFEQIVNKHMLPAMNIDGSGTMDWFFNYYVFGTGIPQLSFQATEASAGAKTNVTLTVDNPGHWHGLLPVYMWKGKGYVRGLLKVWDDHASINVSMPFRPDKIVANQYLDMLVDVKQ